MSIDHALAVSYRRNIYDGKATFVGHITLVKGVPFFGYHVGYRYFLKIYMLNPLNMTRFADLLYQGAIMKQVIQPYESHLQYLLQWMCDFNLYGCAYIECDQYKFRQPLPSRTSIGQTNHRWHDQSIPQDWISSEEEFPRQSHCALELDICVQNIVNRTEVQARDLHATFSEHFLPGNPEEKLVRSLAGLWKDESKRRKRRMGLVDNFSSPFPNEVLVSMSADSRNTEKAGWIHEDEYRDNVQNLVTDELERLGYPRLGCKDFVHLEAGEDGVRSALDSVEDLFPDNLRHLYDESQILLDEEQNPAYTQPVVDETNIPNLEDEGLQSDFEPNDRSQTVKHTTRGPDAVNGDRDTGLSDVRSRGNDERGRALDSSSVGRVAGDSVQDIQPKDHSDTESSASALGKRVRTNQASAKPGLGSRINHGSGRPSKWRRTDRTNNDSQTVDGDQVLMEQILEQPSEDANETPTSSQQLSQSRIKSAVGADGSKAQGFRISKPSSLPASQGKLSEPVTPAPRNVNSGPNQPALNSKHLHAEVDKLTAPVLDTKVWISLPSSIAQTDTLNSKASRPRTSMAVFNVAAPSRESVIEGLNDVSYATAIYQDAFYSDDRDVPEKARDYAGREFKLMGSSAPYLPSFDPLGASAAIQGNRDPILLKPSFEETEFKRSRQLCKLRNWEFRPMPPSYKDVRSWLRRQQLVVKREVKARPDRNVKTANKSNKNEDAAPSQIEGPTQRNAHGFKFSQKRKSTSVKHETQYMSTMSLEVHVNTRQHFVPNPEEDEVACIFWCIKRHDQTVGEDENDLVSGVLLLTETQPTARQASQELSIDVEWWPNELDLINRMVDIVRDYDPDILTGYEVHNGSWGYLIERARIKYEFDLCDEFSRMMSQSHGRFGKDADRWGFNTTSTIRVTGRHMINVWRAMRSEVNLLQYTMENVVFHVLHKRIPHYSFSDLTAFFTSQKPRDVAKTLQYFLKRTQINLKILEANELVPRTSEQARLIGVDFFSVFSRGSQFKVESFMFRIAKPENFLLVSPSRRQVGQQNALECLPLVMEPQSAFYSSPLLVLDFQSLYPSVMIAYNYCYSTCLGRVVNWRGQNKMGFADFKRQPGLLNLVKDSINIAPNGIMFVKPEMRKSLLAKMLGEILETRIMVKSGMKADKDDKTLQQLLNNRQLALKLLANVTYGYTSASFSGRMPCSEIADSIVQTGRETLEKAIALIHSIDRWGAEVVYGDTDSLFVYLKGRTREQAFDIGNEIAATVTKMNPRPIKLKFEKVYHPCVLLAKKRYVGFKYESKDQVEPEFDAKGTETVRRDGTPAEQKIEEKALKILFRTADLSQVKSFFLRQCTKVMSGRVSIQDFCFAREVRLGTYADKGPPPPGALISTKRMLADARTEPQYGERIPYVVISGAPSARLIDRCVAPEALLRDESAELDAEYYISKNLIPPLERIFNLVGANVRQWYDEMPKVYRIREVRAQRDPGPQYAPNGAMVQPVKTLEGYMATSHCVVCRSKLPPRAPGLDHAVIPVCEQCLSEPANSLYTMKMRLREAERVQGATHAVCRSCSGLAWGEEVKCDSKDCPVFYSRVRADKKRARCLAAVETAEEAMVKTGLEW